MASGPSCNLWPEAPNGEISEAYRELLKITQDRSLANLLYASYLVNGVAAQMDSSGYSKSSQGEHKGKDIYAFFEGAVMRSDAQNIKSAKIALGATDATGSLIPITNVKKALEDIEIFNRNHKGLVARLDNDGSKNVIIVTERNADTNMIAIQTKVQKELWDKLTDFFNGYGVDLNALADDPLIGNYLTPAHATDIIKHLKNLKLYRVKNSSVPIIATLIELNRGNNNVTRILSWYGNNVADAAQGILDSFTPSSALTTAQKKLIKNTFDGISGGRDGLMALPRFDFSTIQSEIGRITNDITINSDEGKTRVELMELYKKYNINIKEIHINTDSLHSLESIAARALSTLSTRYRELQQKTDKSYIEENEMKLLKKDMRDLSSSIKNQKYYVGCIKFLLNAKDKVEDIKDLLSELQNVGTDRRATAIMHANTMVEIDNIFKGYKDIVEALTNIDRLSYTESLDVTQKEQLEEEAKKIYDVVKDAENVINDSKKAVMTELVSSILGDTLPNGTPISKIVEAMNMEDFWSSKFYAFSRSTNPVISALGTIVRDAQLERNRIYKDIQKEIRAATRKLYKAGYSSEFMYEKDKEHLISDIDWDAYYRARDAYRESLENNGTETWLIPKLVFAWEINNKMDRVVDDTTGRTESVPNDKYRKPLNLEPAQLEYYNSMIKLKARLESLVPKRAQNLYRPPQVKRSLGDVILNVHKNGVVNTAQGLWDKTKQLVDWSEDDTEIASNGIIASGDEYAKSYGNYAGEIKREIPIHYINKLKNARELMTDFSAALNAEASTLINYHTLNQVQYAAEFMQDYINNTLVSKSLNQKGQEQVDVSGDGEVNVYRTLSTVANNSGMRDILQSYLEMQLYGMKLKKVDKKTKFILNLIGYTSIKALALNAKGAFSNYLMGEAQMWIESWAGEYYNHWDYIWAHGKLIGSALRPGKIWDLIFNTKTDYDSLICEKFGFIPGEYRDMSEERFYKNPLRHLFGHFQATIAYAFGEHLIHYVNGYARLHNVKVLVNGKKTSLYNAYKKTGDPTSPTLKLKDGVTDLYGNPFTEENESKQVHDILYLNQSSHGAMADEDRGVISQKLLGRAIMTFRQWMVETMARRYRDEHWDGTSGNFRSGYHKDMRKLLRGETKMLLNILPGIENDARYFDRQVAITWGTANKTEKANIRRNIAGLILLSALFGLQFCLGAPGDDDNKGKFWKRWWLYQLQRTIFDLLSTELYMVGLIPTVKQTLQRPAPVTDTLSNFLYPVLGIYNGDYKETVSNGDVENKYWNNVLKYDVPFWKDYKQIKNFADDDNVFKSFDISTIYR